MVKSKSSRRWLDEHFKDKYVKDISDSGYRSRASYKLLEMQKKDSFMRPGMTIVDLGAAPGGWSQIALSAVGAKGKILATDILPMEPITGVDFIQGDFSNEEVFDDLVLRIGDSPVDLVISDMAPNISGISAIDQPRCIYLAELALEFARSILKPEAYFLVKVFQGEGTDAYRAHILRYFEKVKIRKPNASRARSKEFYFLAEGFNQ
ncbi:MAG: 23S rRNA (uridine(2552)-2'-O)-methyltransferase RlmE [Pseudohongiellaceae bacterium]